MSSGCGRQEASTRLQPVQHLWLPAARRPACRRVPAMPLDGDRGRAGRPLDGGLARQPALCIESRTGTAQDRRQRQTVERPSEAATGSSRRIVNRVRRDPAGSPVKEWIAGVTAGPGEAGWNPVDAHTRKTILPIPLRSHRRGCPPARGPSLSRRPCRNPCRFRDEPRGLSGASRVAWVRCPGVPAPTPVLDRLLCQV
jgi:hypothetical protein